MTTPREVARRVLDRIEKDGAWATPTLDGELARAGLADRDRRLASELVYGVLRHRTRLDRALGAHADLKKTPPRVITALRLAAYQLLFLDRVPAYAAVDDAVAASRQVGGQKLGGFANAVLRKLDKAREPALPSGGRARIEVEASLPRWIVDELAAAIEPSRDAAEIAPGAQSAPLVAPAGRDETRNAPGAESAPLVAPASGDEASFAARASVEPAGDEAVLAARAESKPLAARASGHEAVLAARAQSFAESAPLVARINRRRTTREALIETLREAGVTATPVAGAAAALFLDGLGDPARSASFLAGLWTVQDTGAQLVAELAAPRAGQRILDACAGVGGKSTHLAELADDAVSIDAADLNATKLGLGAETAQRLGLSSIRRIACDLLDPKAPLAPAYDLIVLDAPCSGLGVLRRHPDAKWRVKPADVPRLADLQRQLIDAVLPRLAPGGILVYSVCTFTRAEGPDQIASLVARSGLRLVAEHRSWPPDADAFYLARLERG